MEALNKLIEQAATYSPQEKEIEKYCFYKKVTFIGALVSMGVALIVSTIAATIFSTFLGFLTFLLPLAFGVVCVICDHQEIELTKKRESLLDTSILGDATEIARRCAVVFEESLKRIREGVTLYFEQIKLKRS